jgi:hypothetical protein
MEEIIGYPILSEFETDFVRKYGLAYGKTCIARMSHIIKYI